MGWACVSFLSIESLKTSEDDFNRVMCKIQMDVRRQVKTTQGMYLWPIELVSAP